MSKYPKWNQGDVFYKRQWPDRVYRVHRVKGTTIFYLGNEYGSYPARGIIRNAHAADTFGWVLVKRGQWPLVESPGLRHRDEP